MAEQRFVIVGTAGHIDHGKTALVQALTGRNTDRLKEEQKRGISIDIDFAPLMFPDGTLIGMVDVPGHERFVRNMVAGAAGIDGALLVIDINEGIKPQTVEHIAVLELLGVRHGVVALTKADLAEPDWLEVGREVIVEGLADTVFRDAPMVVTSTKTGQGMADLKTALLELAQRVSVRDAGGAFRLPVDKVFSIPGFGTVVSGTIWRGQVRPGDVLELLPGRRQVRVRGIQAHGQPVAVATAGRRAALNLTGVLRDQIRRGMVLTAQGILHETKLLDVYLRVLPAYHQSLRHRERVHVHTGTAECTGRVLLLEQDELLPGMSGFAQLLLERPIACEAADPFVLRSYSPVSTLGGGTVVDPVPTRLHRRKRASVLEQLSARHGASPLQRILSVAAGGNALTTNTIAAELGVTREEAEALLGQATERGTLCALPTGWYDQRMVAAALDAVTDVLTAAHRKHRFSNWVPRALAVTGLGRMPTRDADWVVQEGERQGLWVVEKAQIRLTGWSVSLTAEEQRIFDVLIAALRQAGVSGMTGEAIAALVPKRDRIALALLDHAAESGLAVAYAPGWWAAADEVQHAVQLLARLCQEAGPFAVGLARDKLQIGRKAAVALLEYLDKAGVTRREGDVRYVRLGELD